MLTDHQEQLLAYNGELLMFQLSKENSAEGGDTKTTKLCVRRMTFNRDTKSFIEKSTGSICMSGEGIEMIQCSCTSDLRTGILLPCILIRRKGKKSFKYMLLLLHNFSEFEFVLHFKLNYELKQVEPIKLLDGPTVLWSYDKKIFYISPLTGAVLNVPIHFSSIKWAGKFVGEGTVVLGVRTVGLPQEGNGQISTDQIVPKSDALIWGSEWLAYAIEKQKEFCGAHFLPHAYSRVVTCVHVCRAEALRSSKIRTSIVAVTCKSQLIVFQDGLPEEVHQLPYENPCSLQMASVEGSSTLMIVSFTSGEVCAIWKDSLQVASSWKNVKSVLVDDFVGSGTEQILVVLETDSVSDSLSTFQLTDFGKFNYVNNLHCEDDSYSVEELQENHFLTIRALEARLQTGLASVRELQQHLRVKDKVLMESLDALIDAVQGRVHAIPSAEKAGLVSLWNEAEKPLDNGALISSKGQEQFVEEVWYRVVDDRLVIGVKLMESFDLLHSDVSLSLVMDQKYPSVSPTKCQCHVIMLKNSNLAESTSHWQLEPLPKRMKLECLNGKECTGASLQRKANESRTFTAVANLAPFLAFHRAFCMILLHAKRRKESKDENVQKNKTLTLLCGKIVLNAAEILSGIHSVNNNDYKYTGSLKDIVAFCSVAYKLSLEIISPEYTLTLVKTWLLERLSCVTIKEYPDYMFCSKSGSLNGTLFLWNLKTPFEGILTIFCRCQTNLFQCLHSLFASLSPTCKIKRLRLRSKKEAAEQLAQALEKEMATLLHSFSSALNETESNLSLNSEKSKETDGVPAVQQFREAFKKEQKQSMLGKNRTIQSALYREITLNIAEAQLNSDNCMAMFFDCLT